MNQDPSPASLSSRRKCADCGLVNTSADDSCRRCGTLLLVVDERSSQTAAEPATAKPKKRGFLKRLIWVLGATLIVLTIWYGSLLMSSEGLQPQQRAKVQTAIALLEQQGFSREAFVLKRLVSFRSTDSWWNRYVGHRDAYAATNFPFEVITLYPEFFEVPVDDTERAAVLLHEARHLFGEGEEAALQSAWRSKRQLGWTVEKYKQTRVWDATEKLTRAQFPYMFQCGLDGHSDCF